MPNPKKPRPKCPVCGEEPARSYYKYCSNACQAEYQNLEYVRRWRNGEETGLSTMGLVSKPIKRFLRKKFKNKCVLCGWAEVNRKTGEVPLVADHIDGNWKNNTEENLRLVCPNCDALSPTYAGSNRGNGRGFRPRNKRAEEGKLLARRKKL